MKRKVRASGEPWRLHPVTTSGGRSDCISNAVGAAFTSRRLLQPVEARLMMSAGAPLLVLAALFAKFPRALLYPALVIFIWLGAAALQKLKVVL
jgi:cardiolipin synthase